MHERMKKSKTYLVATRMACIENSPVGGIPTESLMNEMIYRVDDADIDLVSIPYECLHMSLIGHLEP